MSRISAKDVVTLSKEEFTRLRPETLAGSMSKEKKLVWVYSKKEKKMVKNYVSLCDATERMLWEGITNASDNKLRSLESGLDYDKIYIEMDQYKIKITNYGCPIPVEKNKDGKYCPYALFGELFTSTNYNAKSTKIAGMNGVGAKLMNLFSKRFKIDVYDQFNKKSYSQEWEDNMKIVYDPIIKPYNGENGKVEIEFYCDFDYFKYKNNFYDNQVLQLYERHCITLSACARIPVVFNKRNYSFKNFEELSYLYFPKDEYENRFSFTVENNSPNNSSKTTGNSLIIDIVIIDTPGKGEVISYANCMITKDKGSHVDSIFDYLNDMISKKYSGIEIGDLIKNLTIICNFNQIENPKYNNQTKTKLTKPNKKYFSKYYDFGKEFVLCFDKWNAYKKIMEFLEIKKNLKYQSSDGKLVKHLKTTKDNGKLLVGRDAIFAGCNNLEKRKKCKFYIVEGTSAWALLSKIVSHIGGYNFIGGYTLVGRNMNILKNNIEKIFENEIFKDLKYYLGLQNGMDYSLDENFETLRYSEAIIFSDSDVDGEHIRSLLILYFYFFYPSLINRGFLKYEKAPIIRVYKGKQIYRFYTQPEFDEWQKDKNLKQMTTKYYKGLASFSDDEIIEDLGYYLTITLQIDEKTKKTLEMVFSNNPGYTDKRKKWIMKNYNKNLVFKYEEKQNISDFINYFLINYSISSLSRNIPKFIDGLKLSQRKIICSLFEQFTIEKGKEYKKECRCIMFTGKVMEMNYNQSGENIPKILCNLCKNFSGTNNMPLIYGKGQFGSRDIFKPAKARYLEIKPSKLLPYIILEDDKFLLKKQLEDGTYFQPEYYLPIIPLCLINGSLGIATGSSSLTPNFNPFQIIKWLIKRIKTEDYVNDIDVYPWYLGFSGIIKVINKNKKSLQYKNNFCEKSGTYTNDILNNQNSNDTDLNDGLDNLNDGSDDLNDESDDLKDEILNDEDLDEELDENEKNEKFIYDIIEKVEDPLIMLTYGKYNIKKNKIIITELPIGIQISDYENKFIRRLIENKKLDDYKRGGDSNNPRFILKGFKGKPSYKNLCLISSYRMSNMTFLDEKGLPKRYKNQYEILEDFYEQRLPFYYKKKKELIKNIEQEIETKCFEYDIVDLYLQKKLLIENKHIKEVLKQIREFLPNLSFTDEILNKKLNKIKIMSITLEKRQILENEKNNLLNKLEEIKNSEPGNIWINDLLQLEKQYVIYCKEFETKYKLKKEDDIYIN